MLVRIFKVALTLVLADAIFVGCAATREYQVDSYQQLQEELSPLSREVYFPDLSHYEDLDLVYMVLCRDGHRWDKGGYYIASNPDAELYGTIAKNSLITVFSFTCTAEKLLQDGDTESSGLMPNKTYRGLAVYSDAITYFDKVDINDLQVDFLPYVDSIFWTHYKFSINGRSYDLYASVLISAEEFSTMGVDDINELTEKAKEEALMLVDSILDQNEVSR